MRSLLIAFTFFLVFTVSLTPAVMAADYPPTPSGPLGKKQLSNCKIFAGENHSHEAQQPKKIDFNKFNLKNSKR